MYVEYFKLFWSAFKYVLIVINSIFKNKNEYKVILFPILKYVIALYSSLCRKWCFIKNQIFEIFDFSASCFPLQHTMIYLANFHTNFMNSLTLKELFFILCKKSSFHKTRFF